MSDFNFVSTLTPYFAQSFFYIIHIYAMGPHVPLPHEVSTQEFFINFSFLFACYIYPSIIHLP
jgi:hypothetical protein